MLIYESSRGTVMDDPWYCERNNIPWNCRERFQTFMNNLEIVFYLEAVILAFITVFTLYGALLIIPVVFLNALMIKCYKKRLWRIKDSL